MKYGVRQAVMAIIVNSENKVLIGSSPRDGGYKFPQGGLEPNEDIISGIKRELKEELAITIINSDIIEVYDKKVSYTYPDDDYYIFESQELHVVKIKFNESMRLIPQDDEFDELHWIAVDELSIFNFEFRFEAYKKALIISGLL